LAEESKKSAAQIAESLTGMSECVQDTANGIESVASLMQSADETVRGVLTEIGKILSDITGLEGSSKTVAASAEELGASSEELTASAQSVASETNHMSDIFLTVEEHLRESREIADILKKTAQNGSKNASGMLSDLRSVKYITVDEFAVNAENAITAHKDWVAGLKRSLETEQVDLETDGTRCKFGIFLSSIEKPDQVPDSVWNHIITMHSKLHSCGHEMEDALARQDSANARAIFNEAFSLSEKIVNILTDIIQNCKIGKEKRLGIRSA
jgi:methyl-accepting chemotaxis protein